MPIGRLGGLRQVDTTGRVRNGSVLLSTRSFGDLSSLNKRLQSLTVDHRPSINVGACALRLSRTC